MEIRENENTKRAREEFGRCQSFDRDKFGTFLILWAYENNKNIFITYKDGSAFDFHASGLDLKQLATIISITNKNDKIRSLLIY